VVSLGRQRVGERARVPALQIPYLDQTPGVGRHAGSDPAGSRRGWIEQQRWQRPVLGVLGRHAAQQVDTKLPSRCSPTKVA
jgi:hypothetical protein